jgi:hypothetical protein
LRRLERVMRSITLLVSDKLAEKMDKLKDVNWSEVCRYAILDEILIANQAEEVVKLKSEIPRV